MRYLSNRWIYRFSVIALDSCPMIFTSTVEEMPRSIIRDANACRYVVERDTLDPDELCRWLEAAPGGPAMPERLPIPLPKTERVAFPPRGDTL